MSESKDEQSKTAREVTFNSLNIEKIESRAGPTDHHSNNESFTLNTKSPNLNLMITPSVYDFPQGKIKQGDFDNYLDDSDGKFKYNSNREPLRKEARNAAARKPGGLGLDALSVISNDVAGSYLEESSALRSKSNAGRDQTRRHCAAGRSGSFASSMQNLTLGRNPAMTPKSTFLNGAFASHAQRSTGKFGNGTYSSSPAMADQTKAMQNLNEQIQKLKKQLHQKEAEYARDKAIWDQKSELADKALDDMRRKLEGQKQQYIQMIKLNHDSPIRCSQNLFTSSRISMTDEQVQSEIKKQAELLAQSLTKERTTSEQLALKAQADADTKLLKQTHALMLSAKEKEMKELSGQILQLKTELAAMTKARQTLEEDKQACQAQLAKEQQTVHDTNSSNKALLDKLKQNQRVLDQLQAQIKALNADMETKRGEGLDMRRQMESLQEKLKESLRGGKERIESLNGENRKLIENIESLQRELDEAKEEVKALEGRMKVERQSAGLQTSKFVDEELEAQVESLRQMLAEKETQIESLLQSNEQAKSQFQTEIQKKDEVILCLTRELRIVQAAEAEDLKTGRHKRGATSRLSHNESDDRTDASAGAGLDHGDDRSRRSRRNWNRRAGHPEDDALRIRKDPSKKKPALIVDQVESRKESIVSFKDSTVSIAFVTQSKKSAVMEPPSFSQDLVGQQVTALQQRQLFGKIPCDMRKCFQPESAGLPHLKKLGAGNNLGDQKRQVAEMYEQALLNLPKHHDQPTKRESEGSDTSARFLSQNFSQNESKYNEVRPEVVDSLRQEEVPEKAEEFYQIAQNVPGDFQRADESGEESGSSQRYNNGGWNDEKSYSQEPIEISTSHLQEPSKNDCTEIEVPVCEKSQNESSIQYPNNQTQGDLSAQSSERDVMAEICQKQLQLLEQRVSTRGLLLQDDCDLRKDGVDRKQQRNQPRRATSRNRVPDNGPIITMSTMTRNEDCMQYSESADVCRNKLNDLTSRQIAIQQQLETGQNHSNSIVLSDGFGSSDLQSNLLQDKSDFTRIIPNELTQYTRSHVDSASNLPSSAVLPMSHNESVHFHQNFPYGNGALKDCGISEVALSQHNISMRRRARAQNHAQLVQEDQSLRGLINEMQLDDSAMSHEQFLHQSQLLEQCLHIQSQNTTNVRPFVEHEQLSSMNSLSGQRFQSKGVEGPLESNEQIQEEFPNESGADSVPQEFHDDQQEVLLTEESAAANRERKPDLFDESRLFTFKKECPLPKSVKSSDVQVFLEDEDCPNPFSSENVEPTNESLDDEEPQIQASKQNLFAYTEHRAAACAEREPKTARSSGYRADLNFQNVTPNKASKHTLNDSIEPKLARDRANLPRRSPMKNHFPENPSGLKSANTSRHLGASSALGNDSSISAPHSATQRQLLFKGKQFQQKDDSRRAGTSTTKVIASKVVQSVKVPEVAGKQKLFKRQQVSGSRSKVSDSKGANAPSSKGASAQTQGLATQRSVGHLDRAKAKHKQRTPSHGAVSDFQSQLQQYTLKHGGLSAIRSEKTLKPQHTAEPEKQAKDSYSTTRNNDIRGKLISELRKESQMMENLTRVHALQSTKTTGAAPSHRKNLTGCKQQPSSALAYQTKGNQAPSLPAASNCLLQRRKDFREVKAKGFRKFDLDSVSPAADGVER